MLECSVRGVRQLYGTELLAVRVSSSPEWMRPNGPVHHWNMWLGRLDLTVRYEHAIACAHPSTNVCTNCCAHRATNLKPLHRWQPQLRHCVDVLWSRAGKHFHLRVLARISSILWVLCLRCADVRCNRLANSRPSGCTNCSTHHSSDSIAFFSAIRSVISIPVARADTASNVCTDGRVHYTHHRCTAICTNGVSLGGSSQRWCFR